MSDKARRRRGWKLWLSLVVAVLLFWFYENFTLSVDQVSIPNGKIQSPVTIVQLSDLHGTPFGPGQAALLSKVERQRPDVIVVTGDMYTYGDEKGAARAIALLTQLTAVAPVYFVPGEHDADTGYLQSLREGGVHTLLYTYEDITIRENALRLYGITNAYFSPTFDLHKAFDPPPDSRFSILLAHIPNYAAYKNWGADLIVCGDTHGGMVRLPFLGPLQYNGIWFPRLTSSQPVYDKGFYEMDGHALYVSSGLGNYPFPVRLFNRPEVSVLTLVPSSNS